MTDILIQLGLLIVPGYIHFFSKWPSRYKILGIVVYVVALLVIALCWE